MLKGRSKGEKEERFLFGSGRGFRYWLIKQLKFYNYKYTFVKNLRVSSSKIDKWWLVLGYYRKLNRMKNI